MKTLKQFVAERIRITYREVQRIEERHKTSEEYGEKWLAEQKASSKTQQCIDKMRAAIQNK